MRLVLCDDHRLFLESLATAVTRHGHEVFTATNPADAVRAVERTDPDVCVLDLNFREESGLDAARAIHERFPRTRVLMLSATDDHAAVTSALELGVSGFIRKDQAVTGVLDAIERVARGKVTVDPSLRAVNGRRTHDREPERLRLLRSLTPREQEVLAHLVDAHDTREIAAELKISESTARSHVQNVLVKLGVHSRLQAVALVSGSRPEGR
jgi:two-component system, NarL family, nitrate/nitrite response regulator NarL